MSAQKTRLLTFTILFVLSGNMLSQRYIPDTIHLKETIVTGSKIDIAKNNVPFSVVVINQEEISKSDESNILPIVSKYVPGLFVAQKGMTGFGVAEGSAGQINIRGLGGNPCTQVLILLDGNPQFMGLMGHHLPDAYASSDCEKVEIIKGPASVLYGSNAYGGVINIISKKQAEDGISLNVRSSYGSYNTQKYLLSSGIKRDKFTLFTSINRDKTDGHRDSSDFELTSFYIKSGHLLSEQWKINMDLNLVHFISSDPGMNDLGAGESADILRGKAAISIDHNFNNLKGSLRTYYNFGEHDITSGWHSNDRVYGIMFYENLKFSQSSSITVGYDLLKYGGIGSPVMTFLRDDSGQIIHGPNGPQMTVSDKNDTWIFSHNQAFYSYIQHTFSNNLTLNTGIRYEYNDLFKDTWIPQAGFSYVINNNNTFKGIISKGYRPPSIRELYLFPPANENLKPEILRNTELSFSRFWFNQKICTEISIYNISGSNKIILVPSIPPPPPVYQNTGAFNNSGVELSANFQINRCFQLHSNYSYIHMNTPLTGTPSQHLFISPNFRIKKVTINAELENIWDLYGTLDGLTEILESHFMILDIKVEYAFKEILEFFFSANNLFNEKYEILYGYQMPGFNFTTGIHVKFKKQFNKND